MEPESVSTNADSDMSEADEGNDTDSAEESDEWSPSNKETDSFVELVFRKELIKAQKDKLLKNYPKPSTNATHTRSSSGFFYQSRSLPDAAC